MTPLIPESYTPVTYRSLQEDLSERLADHLDRLHLRAPDLARRYPTCRQGDIERLRNPEAAPLGLKRLISMCEASGLRVRLEVAP
jgi:hypothetical protein